MPSVLLKIFRIISFLIFSSACAFVTCFLWLLPQKKAAFAISRMTFFWGRGIRRIIGMQIEVHNMPNLSKSGFFIISNHYGYLDAIAYSAVLPLRFAPKAEVFYWPVIGQLVALSRPIWMKRQSKHSSAKNLHEFLETLKNAQSLIVFPEGTTSDGANGLLPFKSSVFEAPLRGNFPILPSIISYPNMNINEVAWFGDATFAPHLWKLLGLKKINVRIEFLEPLEPREKDRKKLAARLHDIMQEKFFQIQGKKN